ncbi:Glutathione synthetase ATP-binding [Fusarium agapanthi]|uniref:Glutathione synthetase ATP-binding n=1 Tax=Fusarium agapanthi TaxID=1803897 RepID=A0A9P5EAQ1_9HYPO|nr:Glutathione synthetase ATP-binding [Fusarium agapanthi]
MPRFGFCQSHSSQFHNLYIAPKVRSSGPLETSLGPGVWISDNDSQSEASQLRKNQDSIIAALLQQCIAQGEGLCVFQVPRVSGFAGHANPWAFRVADCALVSSTKTFLSPLQEITAPSDSTNTLDGIFKALDASIGAIISPLELCDEAIDKLEFELTRRLSFPFISSEPVRKWRLCFLTWSRIAAKRAAWANAKALGIEVVVMSSGAWSEDDKPPHEYMMDCYIEMDMTTDDGFWRRIADAIRAYPDPIDGLWGPWDPFMVPAAKAARDLGVYTPEPEAFSISTNKYRTRQMLDPDEKDFFTVQSLKELESRLQSTRSVNFPVVCKPVAGLSSWGVYRANTAPQLRDAVEKSFIISQELPDLRVVVEPYIDGPEVDCNIVLFRGQALYTEIVDDFPCSADLAEDPTGKLFTESQAAVPSRLPENEQRAITDEVVSAVRKMGFDTGVFHCEARICNSSMEYTFTKGATIPDLEPIARHRSSKDTPVYLHEVNARMPGPMSSASSIIARGMDFWMLGVLCAVGDWSRYEAFSVPFLHPEVTDHTWLINCIVPVSLERIKPLFPDHPADQLAHQAVDSSHSLILELAKTHPHLTKHVARHHVYIEPATRLGGKEGDWLWTMCMVFHTPHSREHAFQLAQKFPEVYEAFTPAVLEWEWEGATRSLATPDPDNVPIRFTIHADSTHDKHRAHFEIIVPVKFKDKPSSAAVFLRISPLFIACFRFSTNIDALDSLKKQRFSSAACLEFELSNSIAVLVPSYVKEPIAASRPRSGKVLDSLYELSHVTALRIYIQDSLLSLDQLNSISDRATKGLLEPFSGPEYDISRMFSGSGAKATKLSPPKPPSYEKATSSQPPSAPSYQRKRPRQDSPQGPDSISQVWDKLQKLESLFHNKVGELTAENAKLRDQKPKPDESQAETARSTDQSLVIIELRAENAQLREEVERLKKRQEDLEVEVASLQTAQRSEKDTEEVAIIEIRDDIESLERRLSWVENGKDEYLMKQIKQEIFDELATRVLGG